MHAIPIPKTEQILYTYLFYTGTILCINFTLKNLTHRNVIVINTHSEIQASLPIALGQQNIF